MKKSLLSLVLVFTLQLAGCSGEPGEGFCGTFPDDALCKQPVTGNQADACLQALQLYGAGLSEGCLTQAQCCFCECWNNGQQMPDDTYPCSCVPVVQGECVGDALEWAELCLSEPSACRRQGVDNVDMFCGDY